MRKYIFNIQSLNEIDTPTSCVAKSSVKYNHQTIDENIVLEKIKATLKKRNDDNKSYLKFVKDENMQQNALRIYRFVGDKMLKDFQKYYDDYKYPTATIARYSDYWKLPIEYEVINWSASYRANWVEQYKEIYDSSYVTKCYKKSPQDAVTINYGDGKSKTMACAEVKSQMELFEKATRD